jgi:hypothetical protein
MMRELLSEDLSFTKESPSPSLERSVILICYRQQPSCISFYRPFDLDSLLRNIAPAIPRFVKPGIG